MDRQALVLNAGSSSLKFCVFRRLGGEDWRLEARGQIESIHTGPLLIAKDDKEKLLIHRPLGDRVRNTHDALDTLAEWLRSMYGGMEVVGVGHRVVHGGAQFEGPTIITQSVLAELRRLVPLAPLHQPYNIAAIEAVFERLPDVPQVACFDTSFHRGWPAVAELIALPRAIRDAGVLRYGFHGLSYEYIASVLPQVAPEIANGHVVIAHLGSGASLCALKDRKSVDCTLSFTALDGLCMGTRPGSIDPGVILYMLQSLGLSAGQVETMLYKESGLLGISGISSDTRELLQSSDPAARLALDYFVYRVAKEIGAMAVVLGGMDGLVFTGGIGENSAELRRRVCDSCAWLGMQLDAASNSHNGPWISARSSKVATCVIPTNEELMIARHTGALLGLIAARA